MKSKIAQRLSLRCKFKDENSVEITVVDHDTGETTQILWSFRKDKEAIKTETFKEVK